VAPQEPPIQSFLFEEKCGDVYRRSSRILSSIVVFVWTIVYDNPPKSFVVFHFAVCRSVLNKSNKSNLTFGFDLNLIREVEI
jgi:hypothetical protein